MVPPPITSCLLVWTKKLVRSGMIHDVACQDFFYFFLGETRTSQCLLRQLVPGITRQLEEGEGV